MPCAHHVSEPLPIAIGFAMRDRVEPFQDAFLEEIGRVGVVVGARGVNEHVAFAGVAVHVRPGGVEEQRCHVGGRNPVIGVGHVDAEPYVVPPLASDLFGRYGSAHENAVPDATPFLGK